MSYNPICSLCRFYYHPRFFKKGTFYGEFLFRLWQAVWHYDLAFLLCIYLLPNGSCGKDRKLSRQLLVGWFKTAGMRIVRSYVTTLYPHKVGLTRMKDGKLETIGEIEVKGRRKI